MSYPNPDSVIGPVCVVLGVLALAGAGFAYRAQRHFLRTALRATGTVQSFRTERMDRSTMYFPVIQFTTATGATVTAESHTSRGGITLGQKLPVLYDPSDPQNVEINAFWSRWLMVMIALFFALVLFGIGGGALLEAAR